MSEVFGYLIPALSAVAVAIVEALAARERGRQRANKLNEARRDRLRTEENRLAMEMAYANMQLSVVTANALTGGKNNGNVERARLAASKAQENYQSFLERIAAEELG